MITKKNNSIILKFLFLIGVIYVDAQECPPVSKFNIGAKYSTDLSYTYLDKLNNLIITVNRQTEST
jgi:hypothetical protein